MAGLGRKEWSPGDTLNAADVNGYLMDQSVMVFAGTAARASAIPSPSAGMVAYSTATNLQVYNGTAWEGVGAGYGSATGGSATSVSVAGTAYTLLTFTTDGTLTVTKPGLFDVLMIAGGGGGGFGYAGGGGAGGKVLETLYFSANQAITIGAGGASDTSGNQSVIGAVAAFGGGSGGSNENNDGRVGGCGGGATFNKTFGLPVLSGAQGFRGGSADFGTKLPGGGGGGVGAIGGNGLVDTGGNGGTGYDRSLFIGGSSSFIGGGGGGSTANGGTGGTGTGGGGNGGTSSTGTGRTAGTANTGGGGGGGGNTGGSTAVGAAGGSGIVYVRFKS
jgi:hypothetical protein